MIDRLTKVKPASPDISESAKTLADQRRRVFDPAITMDDVSALARSEHSEIQRFAASHPRLNPVVLGELVADGNLNVLEGCAASPHIALLPPALLRRLVECGRCTIALASNPHLPPAILASIIARRNEGLAVWALGAAFANPAMNAAQIDEQSLRPDLRAWQLVALAKNPSTPGPIRADLYHLADEMPGDPDFDLLSERGHPGLDPDQPIGVFYARVSDTEDGITHPLGHVRAAAIRRSVEQLDLTDTQAQSSLSRIIRAATDDPSDVVRQICEHYRNSAQATPKPAFLSTQLNDASRLKSSVEPGKAPKKGLLIGAGATALLAVLAIGFVSTRKSERPTPAPVPVTSVPGEYVPINDVS